MKRVYIVLFFTVLLQQLQAQQQAAVWYFGDNAGLDFNSGSPVVLEDGALSTAEGCATMSDEEGNLLFYTDGVTVWGQDHLPMPNGSDLKGHSSSTQSGIIVPVPDNADRYIVFTTYFQLRDGLYYSEIDMNANSGTGDVVKKNVALRPLVTEKLTAVMHRNGSDIWVLAHDWGSNAYLAYLVTASGVSTDPVISNVGFSLDYPASDEDVFKSRGYLKTSPDGSKIAACHSFVGLELLDFDAATGKVSNPKVLMQSAIKDFYGLEFSPRTNYLYASIIKEDIYQFDLNAPDVAASVFPLNVPEQTTGGLQLALDGKIYVAGAKQLAVIQRPDAAGADSGFMANAVSLGTGHSTFGLPPFITSYFNAGIQANGFCFGDTTAFSVIGAEPETRFYWDFGDGETSDLANPGHVYESPGIYNVSVTLERDTRIQDEHAVITIYENAAAFEAEHALCDVDGTGTYFVDLALLDNQVLQGQDPTVFEVSYHRNETGANTDVGEILKTEYATSVPNERLFARVTNVLSENCYAVSEVGITVFPIPEPLLEQRYVLCPDNPMLELDGGAFATWSWRDGTDEEISNSRGLTITRFGIFSLTVTDTTGDTNCSNTIYFDVVPATVLDDFSTTVNHFTDDLSIIVNVDNPEDFQYSIDGNVFQDSPVLKVEPGKYPVHVRAKNGCGGMMKEVVALGYQKFFTPNADGHNDFWKIRAGEHFPESTVAIFDRYGKLVARLLAQEQGWNGTYRGTPLPDSDYWFLFENTDGETFKGHFTLKR
ncbi:T9SS type B sorting domain-containing protein [Maribacter sp. 2-571]|uniref:T9SS type B sorting domain-containing protein n=1 Tax=Maribacter sp. 2-571 TaxID=3417569 RepID=UPI003D352203